MIVKNYCYKLNMTDSCHVSFLFMCRYDQCLVRNVIASIFDAHMEVTS